MHYQGFYSSAEGYPDEIQSLFATARTLLTKPLITVSRSFGWVNRKRLQWYRLIWAETSAHSFHSMNKRQRYLNQQPPASERWNKPLHHQPICMDDEADIAEFSRIRQTADSRCRWEWADSSTWTHDVTIRSNCNLRHPITWIVWCAATCFSLLVAQPEIKCSEIRDGCVTIPGVFRLYSTVPTDRLKLTDTDSWYSQGAVMERMK